MKNIRLVNSCDTCQFSKLVMGTEDRPDHLYCNYDNDIMENIYNSMWRVMHRVYSSAICDDWMLSDGLEDKDNG